MSGQYYDAVPQSASAPGIIDIEFNGEKYAFKVDNGVFSKHGLDDGTRIMLKALPTLSGRILDLGCGWGPVGVILGRTYPNAEIVMADVNTRALTLASENLERNRINNAETVVSDVYSGVEGEFDYIITNPPIRAGKQVVYQMLDEAKQRLSPGGALIAVIRKQQGAESALKHLAEVYGQAKILDKEKSYWVMEARV